MTIQALEDYRANLAELEAVEEELAGYETQIAVQSAATPPYSLHTATLTGLPPTQRVISLLERRAALRASCFAVERFAEGIDDEEVRTVVRLRYLSERRWSWQAVALRLGYRSELTPRYHLQRYLLSCTKKGS